MTNSITSEPEPSDSLKTFGAIHKVFRKRAGLTQEEFAPLVRYQPSTVASIEQGRRLPPRVYIERAEEVLDAFGALRAAAKYATRQPGLASWFREWAELEERAATLHTYECRVVPGLLQTDAYARAVTWSVPPLPTEEQVEQRVAARLARQELLSTRRESPTAFSFIIEQAVLERHTGGEDVTRDLIDHLLEVNNRHWNIQLQLMPLRQTQHAGLDGPIQLIETLENEWFAYSEGQQTGVLISDRKEISLVQQRYAKMRSQALTPDDSVSLLQEMRGAL